jgi:hypothetical protein
MPRKPPTHWYTRRYADDAPPTVDDMAHTNRSAWAQGYNDAVAAYIAECNEIARREGLDV